MQKFQVGSNRVNCLTRPEFSGQVGSGHGSQVKIWNSNEEYILRVKLRYSENLHASYTDYPLAVERMKVKKEWLSPKQQELIQHSGQRYVPTEKLIPNLFDKDEYVIYYQNLQYYISQGMVLEHIYEAIKFNQSPWMKPYIEMNTAL